MEYADRTLDSIINEAPDHAINEDFLLDILRQIANGLVFAHQQKCDQIFYL